jgi:hypothetical protein
VENRPVKTDRVGYWQAENDLRIQNRWEKGGRVVRAWVLEREQAEGREREGVLDWESERHRAEREGVLDWESERYRA